MMCVCVWECVCVFVCVCVCVGVYVCDRGSFVYAWVGAHVYLYSKERQSYVYVREKGVY